MTGVQVDMNGSPSKAEGESNQKGVTNGNCGDRQRISSNDEVRLTKTLANGHTELIDVQPVQTTLQQLPQGPQVPQNSVVRWERFLPLRSLKVLLVENDDSTRHVVSALLRNCSYEVTAVANGLEAWGLLEDLTNHIDLVLTEMDMPYLSGIGLLSKIMNHKTCKNIPVIMTSSNDSMGIVFNCLSKGAVDFLVKPIRKNELKNLWQHVWRRCHSSSGSGSESGIRTQKSIKSTGNKESENDTDSDDEDDNASVGLDSRDGSDNGSGTQSSYSKRAAELDSSRPITPWDQLGEPRDSTCALVIHSRQDKLHGNEWVGTSTGENQKMDDELDLKAGDSGNLDLQLQVPSHKFTDSVSGTRNNIDFGLKLNEIKKTEKGNVDLNDEAPEIEKNDSDAATSSLTPQMKLSCRDIPSHPSKVNNLKDMAAYDTKEGPFLELSLKQFRDGTDAVTSAQGSNFLKHSGTSAFSRYNNSKVANHTPTGNVGSCSPVDGNSEAVKVDSMHNFMSTSSGTPNGRSNGSSNNNDMGSTTDNISTKPEAIKDKLIAKSTVNMHHGSSFQPAQHDDSSLQPASLSQAAPGKQRVHVQHHHHHYHHHHHHVHNSKKKQQLNHDGNAANYGSASGSNNGSGQNGSSEPNGSSNVMVEDGTNVTMDNSEAPICAVSSGGIGSGSGSGLNQDQIAQREAALNKFRQKRKERCFDKKVRYQSRKRLAEERPRVRGQFVRQEADKKPTMKAEDADR
ncbi:hypothetical protein Leryth_012465 [Lithospermum erythrorhizon]|nr:hypothetical protein Leryth_012465 [Lithospermum erythrorhizon]